MPQERTNGGEIKKEVERERGKCIYSFFLISVKEKGERTWLIRWRGERESKKGVGERREERKLKGKRLTRER